MLRIIGIDPSLRSSGYGVIETTGVRHAYVGSGQLRPPKGTLPQRLGFLFEELRSVLIDYAPDCVSMETSFVSTNLNTALKLGQARGALISSCALQNMEVFEYSPRRMKQAVTGYGNATKAQVQFMVQRLLNLSEPPQADEADALGLALCHAHTQQLIVRERVE